MSRAEFFRRINATPKDGLNEIMVRQVLPEIINELNEVKKLNAEVVPSLADDVWKVQNRISVMDSEIVELNKRANTLEKELDTCKKLVSMCDVEISEIKIVAGKSYSSTHASIAGIMTNIYELRADLKKVQNRKVVFSLDNSVSCGEGENTNVP